MPELPDVERFRRLVHTHAGTTIDAVRVLDPTVVRGVSPRRLGRALAGRRLVAAERHGKWLFVVTDGPTLVIHFGMTGALRWEPAGAAVARADRVLVLLAEGRLTYSDRRNLGTVTITTDAAGRDAVTGRLGPDASAVTVPELADLLAASRRSVKATLIDQEVLAGLGNMLTDEVSWRAGLDPARPARALSSAEVVALHRAIRGVLRRAVRAGHIPRGPTWLSGQRGAPDPVCPRCRRPLQRRTLAGRTSLWCVHCQGTVGGTDRPIGGSSRSGELAFADRGAG